MKVYEEKLVLQVPQEKSDGRTVGLHVSEIIRDLAFRGKILDEKWYSELKFEETDTNMAQMGFAFEDYMSKYQQIPGVDFHPGEMSVQVPEVCAVCGESPMDCKEIGHEFKMLVIYMSPDGWSLADPDDWSPEIIVYCTNVLHELKFTFKSSRDFANGLRMKEKKSLLWIWQIMSYCKAYGTLAAKLHVMFARGDYGNDRSNLESMPMRPKTFKILFERGEIEENWKMLTAHAQEMLRNGKFKPRERQEL